MKKFFGGFRFKIVFLIAISTIMTTLVAVGSYYIISEAEKKLAVANNIRVPLARSTNMMAANISGADRYYWNSIAEANPMATIRLAGLAADEITNFDTNLESIKKYKLDAELSEKIKLIEERWTNLKAQYLAVNTEAEKGTTDGFKQAKVYLIQSKKTAEEISEVILNFNDIMMQKIEKGTQTDTEFITTAKKVVLVLSILTMISLILVCILALNAGKQMSKILSGVINHLKSSSSEVGSASLHLSSSASQLSSESRRTAQSVEETVSSAVEVTSMVQENSHSATRAAEIAVLSQKAAKTGEEKIMQLYEAVGRVSQSSKKIEEMVYVIDDIAFQTNILALNASVEAARAGAQGKGFAVVADAVRSLAQKSATAAKDITLIIKDSVSQIDASYRLAIDSKQSLTEIVTSIVQISELNDKIASASVEQAQALTNISKIMNEIDRSSQENVGASEKIAQTSEELSAQSVGLNESIENLVVLVGGKINDAA